MGLAGCTCTTLVLSIHIRVSLPQRDGIKTFRTGQRRYGAMNDDENGPRYLLIETNRTENQLPGPRLASAYNLELEYPVVLLHF